MDSWVKIPGTLLFDPPRDGLKKTHRGGSNWAVIQVDNGIGYFYRHWVRKRYGVILQPPVWGCHCTVIRDKDRIEIPRNIAEALHGRKVVLEYSVEWEKHWKFCVLPVRCEEASNLREQLGLKDYPLHITFGRIG